MWNTLRRAWLFGKVFRPNAAHMLGRRKKSFFARKNAFLRALIANNARRTLSRSFPPTWFHKPASRREHKTDGAESGNSTAGSRMTTLVPLPGVEVTSIAPPEANMNDLA